MHGAPRSFQQLKAAYYQHLIDVVLVHRSETQAHRINTERVDPQHEAAARQWCLR
jgi:hypothetical protein